jgi:hypothetical protein
MMKTLRHTTLALMQETAPCHVVQSKFTKN